MAQLEVFVLLFVLMSVVCDWKGPVCAYPTAEEGAIDAGAESVSKRITRNTQNTIPQNYVNPGGERSQIRIKKRDLRRKRKFRPIPVFCG
ncbi:hypothetical protein TcasGA2_TC032861 [Tribolium castaneum]|uniref:Uncharacterized protein n=1 Tax=Tribolium castaneum TaxID=7070 RepID=A0A139WJH1_TRICA|nr:hypothetical protein TcasGA2_TC032861 [Tribolium castaneum]